MSRRAAKYRRSAVDFWPGFVDAMATLLLVITFLLAVFVIGQFVLTNLLSGRDRALAQLQIQIAELANLLALEKNNSASLQEKLAGLASSLAKAQTDNKSLSALLAKEKETSQTAIAQAELLNQQIAALRKQLQIIEAALEASEARDKESQARIAELGRRLNTALAQKVQELAKHQSQFMAALRNLLKDRKGFEIAGDRFIFQSEVLFDSGSAAISPRGKFELRKVSEVMAQIAQDIPDKVDWVLRVDGHTDVQPIRTEQFPSNWHLSSARAVSVVEFLIARGMKPKRLVAAGFGQFRPLVQGNSAVWYRNRRIEFKLTAKIKRALIFVPPDETSAILMRVFLLRQFERRSSFLQDYLATLLRFYRPIIQPRSSAIYAPQ